MNKLRLGPVNAYHEENGSRNLLIAFQSAGRIKPEEMPLILSGQISQDEVAQKHEALNWKKINQNLNIDNADILFVTDHLSNSYGWYVMDKGTYVHEEINLALGEFLSSRAYNRVVTFGSSKGGSAAALFNLINEQITDSVSLVPQIHIGQYWQKYYKDSISLITGDREQNQVLRELNEILHLAASRALRSNKRFIFYTGTHDDQFKEIALFHDALLERGINSEIFINASSQRHTPLVTENLEFLYLVLESVIQNAPIHFKGKSHRVARKSTFVY